MWYSNLKSIYLENLNWGCNLDCIFMVTILRYIITIIKYFDIKTCYKFPSNKYLSIVKNEIMYFQKTN